MLPKIKKLTLWQYTFALSVDSVFGESATPSSLETTHRNSA